MDLIQSSEHIFQKWTRQILKVFRFVNQNYNEFMHFQISLKDILLNSDGQI